MSDVIISDDKNELAVVFDGMSHFIENFVRADETEISRVSHSHSFSVAHLRELLNKHSENTLEPGLMIVCLLQVSMHKTRLRCSDCVHGPDSGHCSWSQVASTCAPLSSVGSERTSTSIVDIFSLHFACTNLTSIENEVKHSVSTYNKWLWIDFNSNFLKQRVFLRQFDSLLSGDDQPLANIRKNCTFLSRLLTLVTSLLRDCDSLILGESEQLRWIVVLVSALLAHNEVCVRIPK